MTRTTKLITVLGGLCLVLMLGAVATVWTVSAQGSIKDWPPLIIRYSITGQYYAIGDEKAPVATKEILVTYRGLNDWKREIVAAPTVDVGDHSFSEVGSFIEVKNGTVTDYDATASYTEVEDLEPDTYMSPELRLAPLPFEKMVEKYDGDPVKVSTEVRLCWRTVCEEKAQGWSFVIGDEAYIYVKDKRGIPLVIPGLDITEIIIDGEPEPVDW